MNKFLSIFIFIFMFISPFSLYSQDDIDVSKFKSPDCLSYIKNHLEEMSEKDEYIFGSGEADIINNCFHDYMIYNTSNHIMYFIFGEPYLDAVRVSVIPYEFVLNGLFSYSNKNVNLNSGVIEDFKADFLNKKIIFGSVVQTILQTIISLTSAIMVILITYYYVKKIFRTQRGVFDKENIKDGLKMITGATLLAPLPFFGGYSLIIILLFIAISFGFMLVNTFFIFVYSMLFASEINSIQTRSYLNYEKHNEVNIGTIKNILNENINGNACLIKYAEEYISSNVSNVSIIGKNMNVSVSEDVNFFNCLSSFNYNSENITSSLPNPPTNIYFREDAFNYCVDNHPYFYVDNIKQNMVGAKSTCFLPDSEIEEKRIHVKKSYTYLDNVSFKYAKKFYIKSCENSEFRQISGNQQFKCIRFNDFGQYDFNGSDEIFNIIDPIEYGNEFSNLIKDINNEKDNGIPYYANDIYDLAGQSVALDEIFKSTVLDRFLSFNINALISNGWLYSSSIFIPKKIYTDVAKIVDSIDFEVGVEAHVNSLNRNLNTNNVGNLEYSEYIFDTVFSYKTVDVDDSDSLEFISNNFNAQKASECIINREGCNIVMAPQFLNPIEVAQRIFENGLFGIDGFSVSELSFAGAIGTSAYIAYLDRTDNKSFLMVNLKRFFVLFAILSALSILIILFLPLIPFLVFASAILSWLAKLFQAPILIQLFTLSYFTPEENNEDFIDERGSESKIYRLIGEMSLTPLFLVIGVFVSYVIMIISLILLNILLLIAMTSLMPTPTNMAGNLMFMVFYYSIYSIIAFLVVFSASKTVLTTVKEINQFLGFNSFSGSNTFNSIITQLQSKLLV